MVIEKTNTTDCLLDKIPRLRIDNIIAFLTFYQFIFQDCFRKHTEILNMYNVT